MKRVNEKFLGIKIIFFCDVTSSYGLVPNYQTTRLHIIEGRSVNIYKHEDSKPQSGTSYCFVLSHKYSVMMWV
jgi:hypothetical protein